MQSWALGVSKSQCYHLQKRNTVPSEVASVFFFFPKKCEMEHVCGEKASLQKPSVSVFE